MSLSLVLLILYKIKSDFHFRIWHLWFSLLWYKSANAVIFKMDINTRPKGGTSDSRPEHEIDHVDEESVLSASTTHAGGETSGNFFFHNNVKLL